MLQDLTVRRDETADFQDAIDEAEAVLIDALFADIVRDLRRATSTSGVAPVGGSTIDVRHRRLHARFQRRRRRLESIRSPPRDAAGQPAASAASPRKTSGVKRLFRDALRTPRSPLQPARSGAHR